MWHQWLHTYIHNPTFAPIPLHWSGMPQLLQPIALILLAQLPMHASAMQDLTGGLACICSHDLHTSCARLSLRSCSVGFAQSELLFTQALTYLAHLFPLP